MTSYDISVIGLYVLDILGRPIADIPAGGGVAFIEDIRLTVAGTAGGTAVDAAKLGLKTRAAGAVGDDEKGHFVRDTLHRHGIDTATLQQHTGVPTSATILPIRPNGERPCLHRRGASDHFTIPASQLDQVLDAHYIHLGGTGLLAAFDGQPSWDLLAAAKKAGRTTSFDLIAAQPETLALVEPALPHIDFFIPSIEEAQALSGRCAPAEVAAFFLERGVGVCILTLGAEGSYIATADGTAIRIPAHDIAVIDTTGCGDAYSAGFLAGLKQGWDLESSGRLATAAAALVATGLGSDAGIVSLEQTIAAMRELPVKQLRHGVPV